jgi:DedD protein
MTSLLARDEEEGREPDITLSTASLLALFLGLVLVCGVFFGFGYSMGRRSGATAASSSNTPNSADGSVAAAEQPPKPPVVDTQDAPSDSTPNDLPVVERTTATPDQATTADAQAPSAAAKDTSDRVVEDLHPATPAAATLPAVQAPAAPPAGSQKRPTATEQMPKSNDVRPSTKQAMVQVAAVVHEEDADALVAALRKHGFSAVVRTEPQDKLLHIQVGPFADRVEANAMRQRLLSVGYAAIVKQ